MFVRLREIRDVGHGAARGGGHERVGEAVAGGARGDEEAPRLRVGVGGRGLRQGQGLVEEVPRDGLGEVGAR